MPNPVVLPILILIFLATFGVGYVSLAYIMTKHVVEEVHKKAPGIKKNLTQWTRDYIEDVKNYDSKQ